MSAAANIAKVLWGQRALLAEERKPIRESIGIVDTSPLRTVTMRNNFEHLDERLDRWWESSTHHNQIDFNVIPQNAIDADEVDLFRNLDAATGELSFGGQVFNLHELINEIRRIYPIVCEQLN